MRGLLKLIVLAGIAYLAYTEGLPWVKEKLEPMAEAEVEAEGEEARLCVRSARQASQVVSDHLRQFPRPPVHPDTWAAAMVHTAGELSSAESACRCAQLACRPARQALSEMRKLLGQFDRAVRGEGRDFVNPASYREEIDLLLDNAEATLP